MEHTPNLYKKVFELEELLEKALGEYDSQGKRQTLREALSRISKYSSNITEYLKQPLPESPEQEVVDEVGKQPVTSSWVLKGLKELHTLRREIALETKM